MSEINEYKASANHMLEEADKSYKTFIKVLSEKNPEPYLELRSYELYEQMTMASNEINKIEYSALEVGHKLSQLKKEQEPPKSKKANPKKNNDDKKPGDNVNKKAHACCDQTKKTNEKAANSGKEELGATGGGDDDMTAMIINHFELEELHKHFKERWITQVSDMVRQGKAKKFMGVENVCWQKFQAFCSTALERLV